MNEFSNSRNIHPEATGPEWSNRIAVLEARIRELEAALRYWLPEECDGLTFAPPEYDRWVKNRALLATSETPVVKTRFVDAGRLQPRQLADDDEETKDVGK